jgi:7,8-dihydropterin-6-yl-methyl-4-(beta-D-ribofuranosyl)aminobenzene 5'-phosphate synthase
MATTNHSSVTVLVDNNAGAGLIAEHGLALWIEIGEKRILFDTGQGGALAKNAKNLGIDLSVADALVLSHGHYDHAGGVRHVLTRNSGINLYRHHAASQLRYTNRNGKMKAIHMPYKSMVQIDSLPKRQRHFVSNTMMLSDGIGIIGAIPRNTDYEDTGGLFYLDSKGEVEDPIEDELAIWINTPEGLVICVGCCHAGLINILNHVCKISEVTRIRAVIGGFHLLNANKRRLEKTASALRSFSIKNLIPCHCTGKHAVDVFLEATKISVLPGYSGLVYPF